MTREQGSILKNKKDGMNINVDRKYFEGLKKSYNKAKKEGKIQFVYNGNDFVTDYAKYLIEYLTSKFKN